MYTINRRMFLRSAAIALAAMQFVTMISAASASTAGDATKGPLMSLSSNDSLHQGPGSVAGAPNMPDGFADTYTRRFVSVRDVRLHAVIGVAGPPLLLADGWTQPSYGWRMVLPPPAQHFTVSAFDQRGRGLSDNPRDGYDAGTVATEDVKVFETGR